MIKVLIFTTTNEHFTELSVSKHEAVSLSDRVVKYGYSNGESVFPPSEIKCVFWRENE